jgi:LPXTG-motif cell wall-anchored protein
MSEAATALTGGEGSGFYVIVAFTVLAALGAVFVLRRIDWI